MILIKYCSWLTIAIAGLGFFAAGRSARAHGGGILVQAQGPNLVIGHDNEDGSGSVMGVRTFTSLMPSTLAWDSPSFISLSTPPAGTEALPPLTDVDWDFLPMTNQGVTSNLLYWDGQGSGPADVEFGSVPQTGVTMTLYGRNFEPAAVSGSDVMVRGKTINETLAPGNALRLHAHRYFVLDDGDGLEATKPPAGVYLIGLQLRMQGYSATDPFYIAFGTPGVSLTALDSAALPWMTTHVDSLVRDGDYDFDGDVDQGDYATWRNQFGSSGPFPINGDYADGNRDGRVDAADFVFWRNAQASAASSIGALAAVPEPTALSILGSTAVYASFWLRFVSRRR
jgi:hypothetical protein